MASRPSVVWVFMISNSSGVELARLEQDAVGNADLADVVQRRRLEQQVDLVLRQEIGKRGCACSCRARART